MRARFVRHFVLAGLLWLPGLSNVVFANPTYQPVAAFVNPPVLPKGGLVSDGTGNLWGTTSGGGVYGSLINGTWFGDGTVFKVNESTGAITTVVNFDGATSSTDNARGASPSSGLVSDGAGNLWGTTKFGGANDQGTVFKVNVTTGAITTVVDFTGGSSPVDASRGANPVAGLVSDGAGNLWGTTLSGGAGGGTGICGTVFKVNIATGAITTVVDFDDSTSMTDNSRGSGPEAGLVSDGAGNLWGTTSGGGAYGSRLGGYGTVFEVNAATGTVTTVVDFSGSSLMTDNSRGAFPEAGLVIDGVGNLWGTTFQGGANGIGTVFNVNISTGAITTVVDFDGSTSTTDNSRGSGPGSALVSDGAGNLWGTTYEGGANGDGTIFNVNISTGAITTLVDFDGSASTTDNSRGLGPDSGLVSDGTGNLWGTTYEGGAGGNGTIFKVNVANSAITTVADIGGSQPCFNPEAGLVSDGAGNLWGTTYLGGANGNGLGGLGTVFKMNVATGVIAPVVAFDGSTSTTDDSRGAFPEAGLVSDGAGNLWGTTEGGGSNGAGTVFKVNIGTGAISTVVDFDKSTSTTDNRRGAFPEAGLVRDGAGNLWGTTYLGGAPGEGTVFKVNISTGAITTVVDFDDTTSPTDNSRGAAPHADLVNDGAGNLWGTTYGGGTNGGGTVFKLKIATGSITTVADVGSGASFGPYAGLASDGAGYFWGTTYYGGVNGNGTVFKVKIATGAVTTVVKFDGSASTTDNSRGSLPKAGLVSDGAGNFWGTTYSGGANGDGTVFKVNAATGVITTMFDFSGITGSVPGTNPEGSLLITGSGLYGTTSFGGADGGGEIFSISLNADAPNALTEGASKVTSSGATLNGSVNPNGSATSAIFEYGLTSSYGAITASHSIGSGTAEVSVMQAISGLVSGTTYHFRVDAVSTSGTSYGSDMMFTTSSGPVNPFAGMYEGLLLDGSGCISITLSANDDFRGTVIFGDSSQRISGRLNSSGGGQGSIAGIPVYLQFNGGEAGDPGSFLISGTVASPAAGIIFDAYHSVYTNATPAPEAGRRYTLLLNTSGTGTTIPHGTGWATMTVGKTGGAILAGKLPDGESFSAPGLIVGGSAGDEFIVEGSINYPAVTPNGAKGQLYGALTFAAVTGISDVSGTLEWIKPGQTKGGYPQAFDATLEGIGSLYNPPKKGGSVLPNFTQGDVILSDTSGWSVRQGVTLTSSNAFKFVTPVQDSLSMKVMPSTGVFKGTFVYPGQSKPTSFTGVLYQDETGGSGFFIGPNGSGTVILTGT